MGIVKWYLVITKFFRSMYTKISSGSCALMYQIYHCKKSNKDLPKFNCSFSFSLSLSSVAIFSLSMHLWISWLHNMHSSFCVLHYANIWNGNFTFSWRSCKLIGKWWYFSKIFYYFHSLQILFHSLQMFVSLLANSCCSAHIFQFTEMILLSVFAGLFALYVAAWWNVTLLFCLLKQIYL